MGKTGTKWMRTKSGRGHTPVCRLLSQSIKNKKINPGGEKSRMRVGQKRGSLTSSTAFL